MLIILQSGQVISQPDKAETAAFSTKNLAKRYIKASQEMIKILHENLRSEDSDAELYLKKFEAMRTTSGLPRKFSFRVINPQDKRDPERDCLTPFEEFAPKLNKPSKG